MKKEDIIEILHDIEENEDVEIIYACEYGSRVWGFENDESIHDVKFIYKKHLFFFFQSIIITSQCF